MCQPFPISSSHCSKTTKSVIIYTTVNNQKVVLHYSSFISISSSSLLHICNAKTRNRPKTRPCSEQILKTALILYSFAALPSSIEFEASRHEWKVPYFLIYCSAEIVFLVLLCFIVQITKASLLITKSYYSNADCTVSWSSFISAFETFTQYSIIVLHKVMRSKMISQVLGLTLYFLTAAWSLDPTGKYCTLELDPSGVYNCPAGQTCKPIIGDLIYGRCEDLDPTGNYCNSDADCPSGRCGMPVPKWHPWRPWTRNNIGQRKRSRLPRECKTYCSLDDQCKQGEKCASSGDPTYGLCAHKLDPTGKYCQSTKDCNWYLLETCNRNGECVNRFQ